MVVQANIHKKKECNLDLALHANFLLKNHHVTKKHEVVLGMKAYNKKFKHTVSRKDNVTISRSMPAESPSSGSSDTRLTGRSQSSSPVSRHPVQQQSTRPSPLAQASILSMPDATIPETKEPAISKDPLLAERRRFQANIRNYIKNNGDSKGCNGCPTTCNPATISKPSGFLIAIQEPHTANGRITELCRSNTLIFDSRAKEIRSAIWVSSHVMAFRLDEFCDGDIAVTQITASMSS